MNEAQSRRSRLYRSDEFKQRFVALRTIDPPDPLVEKMAGGYMAHAMELHSERSVEDCENIARNYAARDIVLKVMEAEAAEKSPNCDIR